MRSSSTLAGLAVGVVMLAAPAAAFHTVFDYRVDRFTGDGVFALRRCLSPGGRRIVCR